VNQAISYLFNVSIYLQKLIFISLYNTVRVEFILEGRLFMVFDLNAIREALRVVQILKDRKQWLQAGDKGYLTPVAQAVYRKICDLTGLQSTGEATNSTAEDVIKDTQTLIDAVAEAERNSSGEK
jgi:hypothetical protein